MRVKTTKLEVVSDDSALLCFHTDKRLQFQYACQLVLHRILLLHMVVLQVWPILLLDMVENHLPCILNVIAVYNRLDIWLSWYPTYL